MPAAASTRRSASAGESVRGYGPRPARPGDPRGRVVVADADQRQVPQVRAHRGEPPRDRRGRAPVGAHRREPASISPSTRSRRARRATRRTTARSRRYASTVRGERRAASRSRKRSTSGSMWSLIAAGPDSAAGDRLLRPGSRARVRAVVDAAEAPRVDVAVDLRRRERRMAEKLLDRAQVGAALQEVRRVRMAEAWGWGKSRRSVLVSSRRPRAERKSASHAPRASAGRPSRSQRPSRQAASSPTGTRRSFPPLPRTWTCSRSRSTSPRSSPTASAERSPQAIDELDEGGVPQGERVVPGQPVDGLLDVAHPRRLRQPPRPSRGERRLGDARRAERVADERAHRREPPADRRGREPATCAAELRRVVGEDADVDVLDAEAVRVEPVGEVA